MKFFPHLIQAKFISRRKRFIVTVLLNEKKIDVFLPNPGRLWELLFPGSLLYLEKTEKEGRKYAYTVVAVERNGYPILLHTHQNNDIAEYLLQNKLIPGLKQAKIIKREHKVGRSRFDFLLQEGKKEILLEVKSCTLFSERLAMFPDAISARATKHVEELVSLTSKLVQTSILFLVHSGQPKYFLPEYHTDLVFAKALLKARKTIQIRAISLPWTKKLELINPPKKLFIPWKIVEKEGQDQGTYLLLLFLEKDKKIAVGDLGEIHFKKGHYIYVGSSLGNLSRKIARHCRKKKLFHCHMDYLGQQGKILATIPIRSTLDLECSISRDLKKISLGSISNFGSPDCSCPSHLFWMKDFPLDSHPFHQFLQYYRMERLLE